MSIDLYFRFCSPRVEQRFAETTKQIPQIIYFFMCAFLSISVVCSSPWVF